MKWEGSLWLDKKTNDVHRRQVSLAPVLRVQSDPGVSQHLRWRYIALRVFWTQQPLPPLPFKVAHLPKSCTEAQRLKCNPLYIVTCQGFAWLIRRVLDLMIESIGPLYSWLQQFTNHYLTHCNLLPIGHPWEDSYFQLNWTELNWTVDYCWPLVM
jgi:hypothetical protein